MGRHHDSVEQLILEPFGNYRTAIPDLTAALDPWGGQGISSADAKAEHALRLAAGTAKAVLYLAEQLDTATP